MRWLLATSLFLASALTLPCEDALALESETTAIPLIEKSIEPSDSCFISFLNKGWWQAADSILTKADDMGYSLHSAKEATKKLKGMLDTFVEVLESGYKVLIPAFEWAQSPSKVMINVKFSHRIDAPGCVSIADPKVQLNGNYLLLTAFCKDPEFKYKLLLNLHLFDDVSANESSFSLGSSGHVILTLEKKTQPSAWTELLRGKRPGNMHIWWEMKEIYEPDMEKIAKKTED